MSRWYIIHAYSGFENKVRDSILSEAKRLGLELLVEAVEVPTEKVTEIRRGKKVTNDRKFFPGYVLAKLGMSDDVYHLVKNTPKVTGFLGPNGKPQAITEAEAARILSTKEEAASAAPKQKISVDYEIGDAVKVLDGPFASFNGVVEELDFDRGRVKVSVSIFGRAPRSSWSSNRLNGSSEPSAAKRLRSNRYQRERHHSPGWRVSAAEPDRRHGFTP